MTEIALRITKQDGEPTANGIIGITLAAEMLQRSKNTVRTFARDGKIRYFWINYNQPGEAMMLYKVDVMKLQKKLIKQQKLKLIQMEGKSK